MEPSLSNPGITESGGGWMLMVRASTRDRRPIKDLSSIEAALNKWILPAIGDMPLGNVNNITVKPLVDTMKRAKLSAKTVNEYVKYVKQVVGSLRNGET